MKIHVLDHGYVEYVEAWGTGFDGVTANGEDCEVGIVEAARQSTQGSFRGWEQDHKLLEHLYTNNHMTPFEQAGMTVEVQAPIFVFREWHRHRTQSYNEMSARYAPLPDLYYVPDRKVVKTRIIEAAMTKNKQAGSVTAIENLEAGPIAKDFLERLNRVYEICEIEYQSSLASGVPKELARLVMPVGHYSRMRASANLRNWLQFITLRDHPAAQWEIREYAAAVRQHLYQRFPQTMSLWSKKS
jgi:thymidylate synthase (FAD)